ncbi:MAG TPA: hypothetical protein VF476_12910 [Chitinophagaceae bacterium]
MILEKISFRKADFDVNSYVTTRQLSKSLDGTLYQDELLKVFNANKDKPAVIKIGNAKQLLSALSDLDAQCEKIDIVSQIRHIQLKRLLEDEKAIFEIFEIKENSILKRKKKDILETETRYSAKTDLLDYYHLSRFANYCRDLEYEDLVNVIKNYLKGKNAKNKEEKKLRLIYKNEDKQYYLRAITSSQGYKDFGINFSVFVALMSLNEYVENTKNEIFINNFVANDSTIYVSFALKTKTKINQKLSLSFNLILENDEIKRNAVSFNGIFKLEFEDKEKQSEIYLKPKGFVKEDSNYPTDLLTYYHRGSVSTVFERIKELPQLIDFYIEQVKKDAERITSIRNPNDVRKLISDKIKFSKKPEFKAYKGAVFNKLMNISVNSTFQLFELLRQVEELFEHDDVVSRDFWRMKLYESLIERK